MALPVEPPVPPMLARLARELPEDGFVYEPKWDGFRCLAFRDGDVVDLRSRHDRPLARYFPEVVAGVQSLPPERLVLDGEIFLTAGAGTSAFDFAALMSRLHPAASRVERLAREQPAVFVAFDILALGEEDLRAWPFRERRARLEDVLGRPRPPIHLTPATTDLDVARDWLERFEGAGVDGVVAKPADGPYEAGRRAMVKVKRQRTADCVVAGLRLLTGQSEPLVSSLILGLYDDEKCLRHVGVVTQFPVAHRRRLLGDLAALRVPIDEHPWRGGFIVGRSPLGRLKGSASRWTPDMELDWLPLRPERVAEVGFDQVDGDRMRHPARFVRWRRDRDAASCKLDQILVDPVEFGDLLARA